MDSLDQFLQGLKESGSQPAAGLPAEFTAEELGLTSDGTTVRLAPDTSLLNPEEIRARLEAPARDWLRRLEVHATIGSTNVRLTDLALAGEAEGSVIMAELQTAGRGRRGRHWFSPFAANLAMSLGFQFAGGPGNLGGLSLAVGLGVAAGLECAGVPAAELKWPNDVRVGEAKICGILIELVAVDGGVAAVVGIGVNVAVTEHMRAAVDQPVTDLVSLGVERPRSELAAMVLGNVVAVVDQYRRHGFAPMVEAYNRCHQLHGQPCFVLQGEQHIDGVVLGVTEGGQLRLQTPEGERLFDGGEVSLRQRS